MAAEFLDPFDTYTTAQISQVWTQVQVGRPNSTVAPVIGPYGRRGTNGLRFAVSLSEQGTRNVGITLPPATKRIVGAGFRTSTFRLGPWSDLNAVLTNFEHHAIFQLRSNGSPCARVQLNSDGTLKVVGGGVLQSTSHPTVIATTTRALRTDVYYYIWLKVDFSSGSVLLMVNGEVWLSVASGAYLGGFTNCNAVHVGPFLSNVSGGSFDFDDLGIFNGDGGANDDIPVADLKLIALFPQADGTYREFVPTPNTDHFKNVNDGEDGSGHDSDTSYNESDTAGERDTFIFDDPLVSNIIAVQRLIMTRTPTGGAAKIGGNFRSGGTNYETAGVGLTGTYAAIIEPMDVNPATAAPWVSSDIASPNEHGYTNQSS